MRANTTPKCESFPRGQEEANPQNSLKAVVSPRETIITPREREHIGASLPSARLSIANAVLNGATGGGIVGRAGGKMEGNLSRVPPDWLNFIPVSPRVFVLAARRSRLLFRVCTRLILFQLGKAKEERQRTQHKVKLLHVITTSGSCYSLVFDALMLQ